MKEFWDMLNDDSLFEDSYTEDYEYQDSFPGCVSGCTRNIDKILDLMLLCQESSTYTYDIQETTFEGKIYWNYDIFY